MLSQTQKDFFDTFGFLHCKQAFSPEETQELIAAFEEVLSNDRRNRPFDGKKRQAVLGCIEKHPRLTDLVSDDRIYEVSRELLGENFIWIGSDGNLYVGDTYWHPDNNNFNYRRIKIAFYFDPVKAETGCLRVIPGSHMQSQHPSMERFLRSGGQKIDPREVPHFPLESEPGDVVIFNQYLWHASFGGRAGRRMLTLNFGEAPRSEDQLENVKFMYNANLDNIKQMQYTQSDEMYGEHFLHHSNNRIRSVTKQLVDLGFK